MKKSLLLLLSAFTIIYACKKDEEPITPSTPEPYKCTTCITTPEAKAQYDGNSGGVYKGVIVGSTGTIALYLYNTGTEVQALVSFDGKSATLTTTSLGNWSPGQPISNALFTGTIDGQTVQALFSVDANGQNPVVTVTIPGHDVNVAVYKETSQNLVKSFEGTYTGDRTGIFNMVVVGNAVTLVSDGSGDPVEGTVTNNNINITFNNVTVQGTIDGDVVEGTWVDNNQSIDGTWSGNRTL